MVEPVERDSRGILRPAAGMRAFRLDRYAPAPPVARFVDRYWIPSWDLPAGQSYTSQVLSHPVANVVFDVDGSVLARGVETGLFSRVLEGKGRAFGIQFRPAGFHAFLGGPMSALTDRTVPVAGLPALDGLEKAVGPLMDDGAPGESLAAAADEVLTSLVPAGEQPCETTMAWAERAAGDRSLHRVEDLAAAAGVSVRTLQRAFNEHVGIGPKWFLRRYRIYEAAERVAHHESVDWGVLAAELGYADQSHLTRDFTAAVGQSPAQYAAASAASAG